MITAFWGQVARVPFAEVTASSIIREVGCNRATFYYYFDSVDNLALRAVEASVPVEIIDLMERLLGGAVAGVHLDAHTRSAVERLCLLVGDGGSPLLISHLKELLQQVWVRRFDLDTTREDVQAVIAFMASGIVGVLGQFAGRPCDALFDAHLATIGRVFTGPALAFAKGISPEA